MQAGVCSRSYSHRAASACIRHAAPRAARIRQHAHVSNSRAQPVNSQQSLEHSSDTAMPAGSPGALMLAALIMVQCIAPGGAVRPLPAAAVAVPQSPPATFVGPARVVDGDTLYIGQDKFRLYGVGAMMCNCF
jgi:endonuclease YncB( thermonuclease family)